MSEWIEGAALYAVGGDLVYMGATVEARFRPLDGADANLVRAFLDAQTNEAWQHWTDDIHAMVTGSKRHKLANELLEAGVFTSTYDLCSTLILTESHMA